MKRNLIFLFTLIWALVACSDNSDMNSNKETDKQAEIVKVDEVTGTIEEEKPDVTDIKEEEKPDLTDTKEEEKLLSSYDYYEDATGKKFYIRKDKVILKTESETDAKALCKNDVFLMASVHSYVWVLATIDSLKTSIEDLMKIDEVVDAAYGFGISYGAMYLTDRICMLIEKGQSPENMLAYVGLAEKIKEIELLDPELYMITLNVKIEEIIQICKILEGSGICVFADPAFIYQITRFL